MMHSRFILLSIAIFIACSSLLFAQKELSQHPFDISISMAKHDFSFGEARSLFQQLTSELRSGGPQLTTPEAFSNNPLYDFRIRFKYTDYYAIGAAISMTRGSMSSQASNATHTSSLTGTVKMTSLRITNRVDFYRPRLITPFAVIDAGFLIGSVNYEGVTSFRTIDRSDIRDLVSGSGNAYDFTSGLGIRLQPTRLFAELSVAWKYATVTDALITTTRDNSASSSQDIPFELDYSGFILQASLGINLF